MTTSKSAGVAIKPRLSLLRAGPAAVVASVALYGSHNWPIVAGALLLYITVTASAWRVKPSSRITALVFLGAVVLLGSDALTPDPWLEGLRRYRSVVALLFGIALLRQSLTQLSIAGPVRAVIGRSRQSLIGLMVIGSTAILALPLSLAAVALMTTVLAETLEPPLYGATVSMRVVSMTMFLLPTTIASAAVNASIPGLELADLLLIGLPLFIVGTGATAFIRTRARFSGTDDREAYDDLVLFGGVFAVAFGGALWLGASVPEAVALSGVAVFIATAHRRRMSLTVIADRADEAARGCSAEVILMLACGLLAYSIEGTMADSAAMQDLVRSLWFAPEIAYTVVIFVLPAITILGVHPLILFNIVFPLVDNSLLGSPACQYVAWVAMFLGAQLLSPVSISAILAASALGVSPTRTSYRLHLGFALAMSAVVWVYLVLMAQLSLF